MKKLLSILLLFSLIFSCNQKNTQDNFNQKESYKNQNSTQKGFTVSKEFIKADDETTLEMLLDAVVLLEMSTQERLETLARLKETSEVYIKKNSLTTEESILINKSELGPSKELLEMVNSQFENLELLPEGLEMKFLNSGLGTYQGKFDYIFVKTYLHNSELDRYTFQYWISVNNENFHIAINSKEGLEIQDVFNDIN